VIALTGPTSPQAIFAVRFIFPQCNPRARAPPTFSGFQIFTRSVFSLDLKLPFFTFRTDECRCTTPVPPRECTGSPLLFPPPRASRTSFLRSPDFLKIRRVSTRPLPRDVWTHWVASPSFANVSTDPADRGFLPPAILAPRIFPLPPPFLLFQGCIQCPFALRVFFCPSPAAS